MIRMIERIIDLEYRVHQVHKGLQELMEPIEHKAIKEFRVYKAYQE
jgi:hypothetical protein